jgi:hypothetical protein
MAESVSWVMQTTHDVAFAGKDNMQKQAKPKIQWKPLEQRMVKSSTDASFMDTSMSGGIVRDHQGTLT